MATLAVLFANVFTPQALQKLAGMAAVGALVGAGAGVAQIALHGAGPSPEDLPVRTENLRGDAAVLDHLAALNDLLRFDDCQPLVTEATRVADRLAGLAALVHGNTLESGAWRIGASFSAMRYVTQLQGIGRRLETVVRQGHPVLIVPFKEVEQQLLEWARDHHHNLMAREKEHMDGGGVPAPTQTTTVHHSRAVA